MRWTGVGSESGGQQRFVAGSLTRGLLGPGPGDHRHLLLEGGGYHLDLT